MLSRLRSFGRDRRGATAVEFALVALPFLMMVLAIIEYALVFLVTSSLESATTDAARLIRIGDAQKKQMTAADFKKVVCDNMGWLSGECSSKMFVNAQVFTSFGSQTSPQPISNGKFDSSKLQFAMGGPGTIVMVTTYYQWALLTPALLSLSNITGNVDVVSAKAAFRNEPYV